MAERVFGARYSQLIFAIVIALFFSLRPGYAAQSPADFVAIFLNDAFAIFHPKETSTPVRVARLQDLLRNRMDIGFIAQITTSDRLREDAPRSQRRFEELLSGYLVQLFYYKVENSANSSVETRIEPSLGDGTLVVTSIVRKPGSPPEPIEWHLHTRNGVLKITDVISGGISLVTTQRAVFLTVMRTGGLPSLMAAMEAHTR